MLSYFPTVYPEELLYSVLARYHRHVGSPGPVHTQQALFDNRRVIATYDLPGHLQLLAQRIPPDRELNCDRIINTLTLYPYFTAFEPPYLQSKVRQAMKQGKIENLHVKLGLAAFRVGRITRLRFCHECTHEMRVRYGETYWRRDHQLPSVMVCPEHGCLLQESEVSFTQHSRHEFIAATSRNCLYHARAIVSEPNLSSSVMLNLHRLARLSADLLNHPPTSRTYAGWTYFYRSRMLEVGLARASNTMNQQLFHEKFRSFYGETLDALPNVLENGEIGGEWLATMVRKHRKASHPLFHLLVQDFIAQSAVNVTPFGKGPWPCLNPLAQHQSSLSIKTISLHRNHGKSVGVFSCFCGYVYTRNFDVTTGKIGSTRFSHYGPLLEPALRRYVDEGMGLRSVGRALQIDPKTVLRLARELDIVVPWKLVQTVQKRINSEIVPCNELADKPLPSSQIMSVCKKAKNGYTRHNWVNIDQRLVVKLRRLVNIILVENPPVRISIAELERRVGKRNWFAKRQHRLPMTMAYLKDTVESTEEFQIRRIYWAISELEREGNVKAWQVMRKAGLRSDNLERISAILELPPNTLGIAA